MKNSTKVILGIAILLVIVGIVWFAWLSFLISQADRVKVDAPSVIVDTENPSEKENVIGTSKNPKPEELLPNEFEAAIERREGNTLIVKPVDTNLEAKVAKEIGIVIDGKEIDIDEFVVGDKVKIGYFDGIIEEDGMYRITGAQWIEKLSGEN